jgi:bifunctional DNA-binding transcriptional regulator/antitoxin component of YhaV-PrlF toxin-antitoxin module
MLMFKFTRKVGTADKKSGSLRVNIPKEIAKTLDIGVGDNVVYEIHSEENEMRIIFDKEK